jgi:hypothetical protein
VQVSSVGSSSASLYWSNPLARKAKSGPAPSFGVDSVESQAWLWSAAKKVSVSTGAPQIPQTGSKVLMRALIAMLEATLGDGNTDPTQGSLGNPNASAFAVVTAQGKRPMDAYLQQQWVQRMRSALQRIGADLRPGAAVDPTLEEADVQAMVTNLAAAGPGQADEAAFIRSLLTGLSGSMSGDESPQPGSIISVTA